VRYLISIEHPAWANQYKIIIKKLISEGHKVKVLLINQEVAQNLLDSYGIKYEKILNTTGSNFLIKSFIFIYSLIYMFIAAFRFKPNYYIGRASPMMAIISWLFNKPHIIFEDTERSVISLWFCKRISKKIITPNNFNTSLVGDSHDPVEGFKELFYLHPNVFCPDPSVCSKLQLKKGERFILLRFISWNASHDLGQSGFSEDFKIKMVSELSLKYKVFISSEYPLSGDLLKYKLNTNPNQIHSVLYYASALFTESGTMSAESAIIGTPVVYVSTLAKYMGYIKDLQNKYGLLYYFDNENEGYKRFLDLLSPEVKKEWKQKKEILDRSVIDMNKYYFNEITKYNKSNNVLKQTNI